MILVVDHHQDEAQALVRRLQKGGYQAEAVNDGPTALRFLSHIRPGAVLVDIAMPEMDGIQVLQKIRQDSLCDDLPVVMFSADGSERRKPEAMSLGANGFLVKGMADWYDLRSYLEKLVQPRKTLAGGSTPA